MSNLVTTNSMLLYLDSEADGTASLAELSARFGISWKKALELLWDASLVEIEGYEYPFALDLPSRPGEEDEGEPPTTQESLVVFSDAGSVDLPAMSMTLDEIISLLAIIDSASEVTAPGKEAEALTAIRGKLVDAATSAGFGSAMWSAPQAPTSPSILSALSEAMGAKTWVSLVYERPGEASQSREVLPLELRSTTRPALMGWTEAGLRTFRLDRLISARPSRQARRAELAAGRHALNSEQAWLPAGSDVTIGVTGAGRWISESLPGARSALDPDDPSIHRVTFPCGSDEFLAALLIQLGREASYLEPESSAARMREYFSSIAEAYSIGWDDVAAEGNWITRGDPIRPGNHATETAS